MQLREISFQAKKLRASEVEVCLCVFVCECLRLFRNP